jgi:hypothetical protein
MSDVIDLRNHRPVPPTPPESLDTKFGDDGWLLKWCAEWRMARAQQQKNWAEHELGNGWGHLEDSVKLDLSPLHRMHQLEFHLSQCKPRTILLARELLGICVTILAHQNEDPDHTLSQGPVLEIVRNVIASLEFQKADMRVGPKKGQQFEN